MKPYDPSYEEVIDLIYDYVDILDDVNNEAEDTEDAGSNRYSR